MRARTSLTALVIGALAAFGNPAAGAGPDVEARAAIEALRTGEMARLNLHAAPKPQARTPFLAPDGAEITLAAFEGRVTVLNLWATWCPPCRKEMPALDRLHAALAPDGIGVVAVAAERGGRRKAAAFMDELGLENLRPYADESSALLRELGALGLPTTLILDAKGREIARYQGDAAWDAPEAEALIRALAALPPD